MSDIFGDLIIWILLAIGIGFGAIAVIGLVLFPETRSRMYTAERALLISTFAVFGSVVTFGLMLLNRTGEIQYITAVVHTIFFMAVITIADVTVTSIIRERLRSVKTGPGCTIISGSEVLLQEK